MKDTFTPNGFMAANASPTTKGRSRESRPRAFVGVVILTLASIAVGWFGHGFVLEPKDVATVRVFDNWRLSCPMRSQANQSCELDQNVVDTQSGVIVVRVGIGGDPAKPAVDFSTPVNVLLPAGFGLKVDDEPMKIFQYRTCGATGCLVTIDGDPKVSEALLKAKTITVAFSNLEGKTISYPLSMGDFGSAVAALGDYEAKRNSWFRRVLL
jgi:invasion protein IalB